LWVFHFIILMSWAYLDETRPRPPNPTRKLFYLSNTRYILVLHRNIQTKCIMLLETALTSFSVKAVPWTPPGELTMLPRPSSRLSLPSKGLHCLKCRHCLMCVYFLYIARLCTGWQLLSLFYKNMSIKESWRYNFAFYNNKLAFTPRPRTSASCSEVVPAYQKRNFSKTFKRLSQRRTHKHTDKQMWRNA